jgi:2-polyprenyl-3-methyl-5-hydroxy-6-metoxy-1,4-benzoquinol methylase
MNQQHWEDVYRRNQPDAVSWFQQQATMSLGLIERYKTLNDSTLIDVGAGASFLVDTLLARHVKAVTLIDLADSAFTTTKQRLREHAALVDWQVGDALQHSLPESYYDVWHDRAVFHFMTTAGQRQAYLSQLNKSLKHGGLFVVGVFASDGPEKCSGLPVCRYQESALIQQFATDFQPLHIDYEIHSTPSGNTQSFIWGCFEKM